MAADSVWNAVERVASSAVQNWELRRTYTASLFVQEPGFTELWGDYEDNNNKSATDHDSTGGAEAFSSVNVSSSNEPTDEFSTVIQIHQYRPAWLEQLVLRVAGLPARVINSPYAVYEVTGPLPCIQDATALVSRDDFLTYLLKHRTVDLDRSLSTERQRHQSLVWTTLIRETLQPALHVLRYSEHSESYSNWESIYRPQCIKAASSCSGSIFGKVGASWQAWSERTHAQRTLKDWGHEEALQKAREAYASLADQLGDQTYLMGTDRPTCVDCWLWDHLLHALADIHLVIVLAEYPRLARYVQTIWDSFHFGTGTDTGVSSDALGKESLSVCNFEQNALNAFCEIPLLPTRETQDDFEYVTTAIDLMRNLSIRRNDLQKTLELAKKARMSNDALAADHRNVPLATWHRWRMGGSYHGNESSSSSNPTDHTQREYQRNDEIWLASVAAITVAVMLGFGLRTPA